MDEEPKSLLNFETKPPRKAYAFFLKRADSLHFISSETPPLKSMPYKQKAEVQHRARVQGTGFCLLHEMLQAVLFIMWKRARRAFGWKQNCKRLKLHNQESQPHITTSLAT